MAKTKHLINIPLHEGFLAEVFKGKDKQWYWRVVANNNEIVVASEGYKNKQDALDIVDRLWPLVDSDVIEGLKQATKNVEGN